ncbi:DUF317 domain-containing protein [Streptomyces bambusae]|uniref:DUF317 domain-containing protein n=1 Tax=Streptomyces bambusae TaxID=1550616 RepID=UPI001CFEEC96|nr:DUF317 domain-containing protein [Streptomyces bambusae]MCB5163661.1 DUF317 domain-containing protein [Streptomyces bambusae]
MPRTQLTSPDQVAVLHLAPDPDQPWWVVRQHRTDTNPAWSVKFGARTPVEIIAALTDALTAPAAAPAVGSPYEPLLAAGWRPGRDHDGLTSPDGIAHVEHFTDNGFNSCFIDVAVSGDPEGQVWKAFLSGSTPPHLVTAVTRALADPTPIARDPHRLPDLGHHLHTTTVQVPAADVAFALERRIEALTTLRPNTTPSAAPPAAPPSPRRTR